MQLLLIAPLLLIILLEALQLADYSNVRQRWLRGIYSSAIIIAILHFYG